MEESRHPYTGKKQEKIKEEERLREGFLRIRDGEKYIVQDERNTFSVHIFI